MATFTVSNTNDSGAGSLRQAITSADASTGKNIINFCGLFDDGLAHTISLTGGGLSITDDIIILGTNPNLLTISEDSASRVFDITSGATATINGLTITNTYNSAGGGGGVSNEGVLTLSHSIITGNAVNADDGGGGIYNSGSLTVNYSTISDNSTNISNGIGGGIYNSGSLTVNHSNITGNQASSGGGIFNYNGTLTVNYSYIAGNTVYNYGEGGGIFDGGSGVVPTTVNYSYITGNTALEGAGIYVSFDKLTVSKSIITDNNASDGGGIYNSNGTLLVNNSAISNNYASYYGGGIDNSTSDGSGQSAIVTVSYSSINGNTAGAGGGGIYNNAINGINYYYNPHDPNSPITYTQLSVVTMSDSTISDNQAHFGAGIYNDGTLTVSNSAIEYNNAFGIELSSGVYQSGDGGGIYNNSTYGGTTTVYSNAIAFNLPNDIAGNFINNGYNWIGATTSTTAAGDAA